MTPEEIAAQAAKAAEEAKVLAEEEAAKAALEAEEKEKEKQKEEKVEKRPSSVAVLLAQRNAARNEAKAEKEAREAAEAKAAKVDELEELVAKQAIEFEAKAEKWEFFSKNPHAKEFEADIEALKESKGLSYDDAAKLVIADKKPELLLEEAVRNKKSGWAPLTWVPKENVFDGKNPESVEDFSKMSADDFLKWGNEQALKERNAAWKIR